MIESVVPVIGCIALGKFISSRPFFSDINWSSLEKVMFWIFLPVLIFQSIVLSEGVPSDGLRIALLLASAQVVVGFSSVLHAKIANLGSAAMTSLFQNAVRWNNIIPIAIVSSLYGPEGMAIVAIALTVMVPIANISCIFVLEFALAKKGGSLSAKIISVIKNPLVIACLLGVLYKFTFETIPDVGLEFFRILSSATLGVGLLVVGASINWAEMNRLRSTVVIASATKLLLMPVLVVGSLAYAGVGGVPLLACAICAAAPTAMQGLIVAKNMGGDADIMSSAIAAEHVLCLFSIPLVILFTGYIQ